MQLLLTDRLTCPRCGPTFGLVLFAERMVDRRVRKGALGCPNCRDSFPVVDGVVDLRAPPRGPLGEGRAEGGAVDPDLNTDRLVALLGIERGPGTVAMVGRPAHFAERLAGAVDDLHVVAVHGDAARWPDMGSVTRMVAAPGLPFFSRTLRGVVVDGGMGEAMLREAARVTAPMSRVVVTASPADAEGVLRDAGLTVLAADDGTVVAARG